MPTSNAPPVLRPISATRATVTLTNVNGHHPTGAEARSSSRPAAPDASTAAHTGSDHAATVRRGASSSGAAADAGVGRVVRMVQVSFWWRRAR